MKTEIERAQGETKTKKEEITEREKSEETSDGTNGMNGMNEEEIETIGSTTAGMIATDLPAAIIQTAKPTMDGIGLDTRGGIDIKFLIHFNE